MDNVEVIAQKLNLEPCVDLVKALNEAARKYTVMKCAHETNPSISKVAKELKQIAAYKVLPENWKEILSHKTRLRLLRHNNDINFNDAGISEVQIVAEEVLCEVSKDEGGRPSDRALDVLVESLAEAFEKNTKKSAIKHIKHHGIHDVYRGDFFDLCIRVISIIDPKTNPVRNKSLQSKYGKSIYRILKKG